MSLIFNNDTNFDNETQLKQNDIKIHIHVKKRNNRKCITIVSGLSNDLDLKAIVRYMKRKYGCSGIINDENKLEFSGDQRESFFNFLIEESISKKDNIIIHGF